MRLEKLFSSRSSCTNGFSQHRLPAKFSSLNPRFSEPSAFQVQLLGPSHIHDPSREQILVQSNFRPSARHGLKVISGRHVRSKCQCSCVLQFTLLHAVSCVLHRPVSRVIHHSRFLFVFFICIAFFHNLCFIAFFHNLFFSQSLNFFFTSLPHPERTRGSRC